MKELKIFTLETGKKPLDKWLYSLDKSLQYRILDRLSRLQEGFYGDFKIIDNEIKELRFKFGQATGFIFMRQMLLLYYY